MDTIQEKGEAGLLTPLFEARLQYQSDMEVVVSAETREGELVGSGDGTVTGAALSGTVRWSMLLSPNSLLWAHGQSGTRRLYVKWCSRE